MDGMMVTVLMWIVIGGGVGYIIGKPRKQENAGFLLGMLLGIFGWVIVAIMPNKSRKCPECGGFIDDEVKKCKHCGSSLEMA
jgi:hypothetical protein